MELIDMIVSEDRKKYKCYNELKKLIVNNPKFKEVLIRGIATGKVYGFSDELWEKINEQNIRGINSFEDVFRDGANIGFCTVAAKQLSYSLNGVYLCGGTLPILEGSINCPDGGHTWILNGENIIDTTLMLVIDKEYSKKLGYIEENRYNPSNDYVYNVTKDFTLDKSMKKIV